MLKEEDECFREGSVYFSKQGDGAGTCACHSVAKAVQKRFIAYMRGQKKLHPAMLVGWIINNSSSDVANGNDPDTYSGIEG